MADVGLENKSNSVWLLGKRYPVIACNMTQNSTRRSEDSRSCTTQDQLSEGMDKGTGHEDDMLTNTASHSEPDDNANQTQAPDTVASGNDAAARIEAEHSQDQNITVSPSANCITTSDHGNADEELTIEDGSKAPVEITDVVNLALSIAEEQDPASSSANQSFEYQASVTETSEEAGINAGSERTDIEVASDQNSAALDEVHTDMDEDVPQSQLQSSENGSEAVADASALDPQEVPTNLPPESLMDGSDINEPMVSISAKMDILNYASAEWKGTTYTAQCLRKGYQMLIKVTGCSQMRQVRGDNYCALRATAFQILTQELHLFRSNPNWEEYLLNIVGNLQKDCEWINHWSFARRLPSSAANCFDVMNSCITFFTEQLKLSQALDVDSDRQMHFATLFNCGSTAEIKIFEALKLIMLDTAKRLHDANCRNEEVPVFAWLLFARDTSTDPKTLMFNHLNHAGNSGGLEQVEMCLLGQALELSIRVIRPSNVDQEDFVTHYPDHMVGQWDKVDLIAEDDRHYNIVVK